MILARCFPVLLLFPYLATIDPDSVSDSELSVALAVGGGSYAEVARDCSGHVTSVTDKPYNEVAGSVRYRTSVIELGLTGGRTTGMKESGTMAFAGTWSAGQWVREEPPELTYVTPSVGLTTPYFGLEIGCLLSLNDYPIRFACVGYGKTMPTGMIRIGRFDKTNFSASLGRNLPLISGGGLFDVGFSSPVGSNGSRIWYGIGGYPYDGLVFSLKGDVRISDHIALTPTFHMKQGDAFEYGWSIGGRARF